MQLQIALHVDWRDTHWFVGNLTVHGHMAVHKSTRGQLNLVQILTSIASVKHQNISDSKLFNIENRDSK